MRISILQTIKRLQTGYVPLKSGGAVTFGGGVPACIASAVAQLKCLTRNCTFEMGQEFRSAFREAVDRDEVQEFRSSWPDLGDMDLMIDGAIVAVELSKTDKGTTRVRVRTNGDLNQLMEFSDGLRFEFFKLLPAGFAAIDAAEAASNGKPATKSKKTGKKRGRPAKDDPKELRIYNNFKVSGMGVKQYASNAGIRPVKMLERIVDKYRHRETRAAAE